MATRDALARAEAWDPTIDHLLLGLAILTHGVADIAITAIYWEYEINPVVLALGFEPWVALKGAILAAAVLVWRRARDHPLGRTVLVALVTIGVVALAHNLVMLALGRP